MDKYICNYDKIHTVQSAWHKYAVEGLVQSLMSSYDL